MLNIQKIERLKELKEEKTLLIKTLNIRKILINKEFMASGRSQHYLELVSLLEKDKIKLKKINSIIINNIIVRDAFVFGSPFLT
jgi:cellulose biosynthesis protein BcsQ